MEKIVAAQLNEPVMAAVLAAGAGSARSRIMGGVGGVAGVLIAGAMNKGTGRNPTAVSLPPHSLVFVALTPSRLALFAVKRGFLKNKLGEPLAIVPRVGGVRAFTVSGGLAASPLTIELTDGRVFALEVPRLGKGKAQQIAAAFVPAGSRTAELAIPLRR